MNLPFKKNSFKTYVWFIFLLFILLSPNMFLIFKSENNKVLGKILLFLFALDLMLLPLVIFRISIRKYLLWLSPLLLLVPGFLLNIQLYGEFPSHWLLLTTYYNANDALELLSDNLLFIFTIPFLILIYVLLTFKALKADFRLKNKLFLYLVLGVFFFFFLKDVRFFQNDKFNFSAKTFLKRLDLTFPLAGIWDLFETVQENKKITSRENKLRDFSFQAKQKKTLENQEIYVLIIGETARYKNFGINGYSRNTTPNLEKIKNLIAFSDVSATASITLKAIPLMLTNATATNYNQAFEQRSFLTAFKEAGFKTYWISNLHRFGKHDTNNSIYANEADFSFYNKKLEANEKYKLDETLLPILDSILALNEKKSLIVLHTLGSHYNYSKHYSAKFDVFQPSIKNKKIDRLKPKNRQAIINSYDNSILYTDFIVSEIIKKIQAKNATSLVWYLADHGENLFDDEQNLHLHGLTNYYDLHIPMFIWQSDFYQKNYPKKSKHLKAHQYEKISSDNLFHSIIDLANISYLNQDLSFSLADSNFKVHSRKALSLDDKIIDYENLLENKKDR